MILAKSTTFFKVFFPVVFQISCKNKIFDIKVWDVHF